MLRKLSDSEADILDISRSPDLTHDGIEESLQVSHREGVWSGHIYTACQPLHEICTQLLIYM